MPKNKILPKTYQTIPKTYQTMSKNLKSMGLVPVAYFETFTKKYFFLENLRILRDTCLK